jgi:serine protease Do
VALALAMTLTAPGPLVQPARGQGTLSAIEADVDQVAHRARPSMVTVVAQKTVVTPGRGNAGTVRRPHSRVGSGVAVGPDEIITTASVVLGAEKLMVLTANDLQATAELVGLDPIYNIALLRVPGLELPAAKFASRTPQVGDWVILLGSSYRAVPTQSVGNIAYRFDEPRMSLLQLTNQVYPGNSGGAALNSRGELIGLVEGELGAPEAPGQSNDGERRPGGTSFAIPSADIVPVVDALRREGRVRHGFLGISTRAGFVDSDTQPGLRVPLGAIVESMQAGGPAEKVGLKRGDLVVAYMGERVEYPEQLARWVAATPPGTPVTLVWVHDEMRQSGRVVLGEAPAGIPSWMKVETSAPPVASSAPSGGTTRIADLEEQIRRLSRELDRLRSQTDTAR